MLLHIVQIGIFGFAVYCAVALALLAWPLRVRPTGSGPAPEELRNFVAGGCLVEPAPPRFFTARDGAQRLYRLYRPPRAANGDMLVLLHGSGSDSRYLARLAASLAENGRLAVVTLDMRGHGPQPISRGDVDVVDRQEWDIADLVQQLRHENGPGLFFLGGHSIGGGLAIRYAAGDQMPKPDGLVLIAPYVDRRSPAARPGSGGWATPFVTRFAGIEMTHRLGIHTFDGLPVLRFEIPPSARDGTETPLYSWRLFSSVTPRQDWRADLRKISSPVLVLAAEKDTIFKSTGYSEVFKGAAQATVEIVPRIDHFELVTSPQIVDRFGGWLRAIRYSAYGSADESTDLPERHSSP